MWIELWNYSTLQLHLFILTYKIYLHLAIIIDFCLFTGGIKFKCKNSSKEIYHVMTYARNSIFSAFSNQSKLNCVALKFRFFCTKIWVLTCDHQFELKLTENKVITCSNSNFSAKNLNFGASQLNFDWFENALKFEFLASAITW